jgi:hypothetical protein
MRILFFMSHPGLGRHFEWTLRLLAERGHEVCVALDHRTKAGLPGGSTALSALDRDYADLTIENSPRHEHFGYQLAGGGFRLALDYIRYLESDYRDAEKARARVGNLLPSVARRLAEGSLLRSERVRRSVGATRALAERSVPPSKNITDFIAAHRPDVVVVTPLVDPGGPQAGFICTARTLGIPTLLPVASWDNLTLKGGLHATPDIVAVWNEAQRREAVCLHEIPDTSVRVTGAVPYDHWFTWSPRSSRDAFCRRVGFKDTRPYILYLGSSPFAAPTEPAFLNEWLTAIRAAAPPLREFGVLVRPHPLNPFDEQVLDRAANRVAVYPAGGAEPADEPSRADYFDSIYHSAAVVGVNTSGLIEAAIVDRPVHTVLASRYRDSQMGTLHFQHLLPESGGMLDAAPDYGEHARRLLLSVTGGSNATRRNQMFVSSFVRPFGLEAAASPQLVAAIEELAATNLQELGSNRARLPRFFGRALAEAGRAIALVAYPGWRRRRYGLERANPRV